MQVDLSLIPNFIQVKFIHLILMNILFIKINLKFYNRFSNVIEKGIKKYINGFK